MRQDATPDALVDAARSASKSVSGGGSSHISDGSAEVAGEPAVEELPWYADGLRFECTQSGKCCAGKPGSVWLNDDEIASLAGRFEVSSAQFEQRYARRSGVRRLLREQPNGDCIFFDGAARRCGVYEHRPTQCRTWPFWSENVATEEAWSAVCEGCPGTGQGRLHRLSDIKAQLSQDREAERRGLRKSR